ncbi:hypothetical protein AB0C59_12995 [Streptomyces sp. NPDC048664]|uniref:hypothetical protein n=1 Tax=Streptomyces sp. NPDC048664 TaxID=3154505 RepID=UPI00341A4368
MNARRGRRALFASLATAAVLAAGTGAAAADGTTATATGTPAATPTAGPKGDGAKALCKRVPKIDRRIARALKRLDAGVTVKGSVARLQQRVDNAKREGHTEIATFLQDRLTHRTSLVTTLQQRQKDLAGVKTWCAANDNGKDGKDGKEAG